MKLALKLSEINARIGLPDYEFDFAGRANIYLTNSLEGPSDGAHTEFVKAFPALAHESLAVNTVKRLRPFTVILGNPPSVDPEHQKAGAMGNQGEIMALLDDWRPPISQRTGRQNTQKQLNNDFVKFFRWACHKLAQNHIGVVAFVLPSSFAGKPSYKHARQWLVNFLQQAWILALDADSRRGVSSDGLFATLQGRMEFIGYRRPDERPAVFRASYGTIEALDSRSKHAYLRTHHMLRDGDNVFNVSVHRDTWKLPRQSGMTANCATEPVPQRLGRVSTDEVEVPAPGWWSSRVAAAAHP